MSTPAPHDASPRDLEDGGLSRAPQERAVPPVPRRGPAGGLVPIRSLAPRHGARIRRHLKALDAADRHLRFGYAASDAQIDRYVDGLNWQKDRLLGILDRRLQLVALAHLALGDPADRPRGAEFGVSVARRLRGRGLGWRLFQRALVIARNEGIAHLHIHALSENQPMLHMARRAGAQVVRHGSESEACLVLPPADLDSRLTQIVQEQFARADSGLKRKALQWHRVLDCLNGRPR